MAEGPLVPDPSGCWDDSGLVVGRLGGLVTVAAFIAFYLTNFLFSGRFPDGPYFLVFADPGFLFLLSWMCHVRPWRSSH
jgi:hypothetical protein